MTVQPRTDAGPELAGRRVVLRPLAAADWRAWREVRTRCQDWLTSWEPMRSPRSPDVVGDPAAFASRCAARDRERHLGVGYGFGIFVARRLAGEVNLSNVQRGPMQNAYVGYWVDEALAGQEYVPEAVAVVFRFAFEELALHRLQIAIVPRNQASRRVVEKLELREEGIARRYLEINGVWEDHVRYAITAEEWQDRRPTYAARWLGDGDEQ